MANEANELCGPDSIENPIPKVGIGEMLYQMFSEEPSDAIVLIEGDTGRQVDRRQMLQLCTCMASSLQALGLGPGDEVALIGDNSIDLNVAAFGIAMMGGVICPIDPNLTSYELQHALSVLEPKLVVADEYIFTVLRQAMKQINLTADMVVVGDSNELPGNIKRLDDLVEVNPYIVEEFSPHICTDPRNELLLLVFSSGTTGLPKAVMLSHYAIIFHIAAAGNGVWRMGSILQTSFFHWISGLLLMFGYACKGGTRVLLRKMDSLQVMKTIQDYKVMVSVMSPSLLASVLLHPQFVDYDLSSLRFIHNGGSLLVKTIIDKFHETLPNCTIIQVYGLTEMGGPVCRAVPPVDVFSLGKPIPFAKVKVIDETGRALGPEQEGELILKSPAIMKGYLKNEAATKATIDEEGWLHSGDLGMYTSDGVVYLTGRVKFLFKIKNHQISPAEIENLISTVPGVVEVVVVGIQEDENSLPMALVVRDHNYEVSEEDIARIVNDNLSDFKQLRGGIVFVDSLPKTSTGKTKRQELQRYAEALYMNIPL